MFTLIGLWKKKAKIHHALRNQYKCSRDSLSDQLSEKRNFFNGSRFLFLSCYVIWQSYIKEQCREQDLLVRQKTLQLLVSVPFWQFGKIFLSHFTGYSNFLFHIKHCLLHSVLFKYFKRSIEISLRVQEIILKQMQCSNDSESLCQLRRVVSITFRLELLIHNSQQTIKFIDKYLSLKQLSESILILIILHESQRQRFLHFQGSFVELTIDFVENFLNLHMVISLRVTSNI